jgi:YVTN family beta-propeller protein
MDPSGVAITPNGEFAYVVNSTSNNVSVIDTTSNAVVATVTVGANPPEIAITPNGKFAYVTNGNDNNVSVIDTSSNTVVATVTVGLIPFGVAITPNGEFAYVTNANNSNISVIDTNSNTVVVTVTVGSAPAGVAITLNGEFAYVANAGSNNVFVIDTSSNTVVAIVTVGAGPIGIAMTPVSSPQNLTAQQEKNDFGFVYELFNRLKWSPGLSQVSGYVVYRNGIQIATLSAFTFEYDDHDQKKGVSTTYSVVSIDSAGSQSSPSNVTVK